MEHVLNNPVYNALISGDETLSFGNKQVRFFEEQVSPFAGFAEEYEKGFEDLFKLIPPERKILFAIPKQIEIQKGWKLLAHIPGLQFVLDHYNHSLEYTSEPVQLTQQNVEEMINLAKLTKPGPFDKRTIEFGHYFGIFQDGRLAAMTGQRLHVYNYTEISAVCTHPDYLGKGFAGILLHHQVDLIRRMGQTPFLHVRSDNVRAIELYERTGFTISRPMNFYFLQKN